MSLVRVSTKKSVTPRVPKRPKATSQSVDVQYPITWFTNHSDLKPVLSITLVCDDLNFARQALRKGILDNNINLDVAKSFLYYFGLTIKSKLNEQWKSYGRVIGEAGAEISPLNLVRVESTVNRTELQKTTAVTASDDGWMAGYILAIYRLTKATNRKYKQQIATRVSTQLKAIKSSAPDLTDIVDIYKGWTSDKGYSTLVAVYDMYFNKLTLHSLSSLRIGTTGSRFRDCAALLSFGYLTDLLGMSKITDLMDWVFLEHIGNDIDRMMTSKDELLDNYSYFPYHMDLGLVTKSAFSATANPHFFEWVHVIGALMKAQRSLNAKHISDSRSLDILANAACVAYAFSHTFAFSKVNTESGAELVNQDDDDEDSDDSDGSNTDEINKILKSRNPTAWCTLIKSTGMIPKKVKRFVVCSMSGSTDIRKGTIEEHVKRLSSMFNK